MKTPPDPFSRLLAVWCIEPARDPGFRTQVWHRIESLRQASTWSHFARTHPAAVAGALSIAVVLGAVSGREQARASAAAESSRMASVYVQKLDARTMTMP